MRRRLALFVTTCFVCASPAYPWWEIGHQVVARLAAARLTPAARTRIARILNVPDTPEAVAAGLAKASTWADETKAQTGTSDWHFIDLTLQDRKADILERCRNKNCVTERIHIFAAQLAAPVQSQHVSQLDALRYLVHFVGDVHQPLHTVSDADLGGNCEQLRSPVHEAKNLHALWDGGIIGAMDVNDTVLAGSLQAEIQAMSEEERHRLAAGNQDDWTWESHELAITDVYQKLHIPLEPAIFPRSCADAPANIRSFVPDTDSLYINAMKPVVREQLTKAGLRLARLLNESL
jgi:hypothetical protein